MDLVVVGMVWGMKIQRLMTMVSLLAMVVDKQNS
jgi:hypothetical protein